MFQGFSRAFSDRVVPGGVEGVPGYFRDVSRGFKELQRCSSGRCRDIPGVEECCWGFQGEARVPGVFKSF